MYNVNLRNQRIGTKKSFNCSCVPSKILVFSSQIWKKTRAPVNFFTSFFKVPWIFSKLWANMHRIKYWLPSNNEFPVCQVGNRVDMVGTNHDKVLTQWRHMPMGQFCANIFLIRITSTYFWASEVFKNRSSKSWLFWFSKWNIWKTCVN
jgi:hypothetical protein